MKYLFILFVLCVAGKQSIAQTDTAKTTPLYAQYPLPQFSILLTDSVTWYTKNDLIKKNISRFSGTQIVMVTPMPFHKMQEFYEHFELHKFKNITVGRDPKFFFSNYFKVHYLPFLAIYDKNYKLLKTFEGSTKWEDLVKYL